MLMIEAKKLIDTQHYPEAAEKLKRVSELNVNVPDTFSFHYGIALAKSGDYEQGKVWLDKYISQVGSSGKFYKEALEAYAAAKDFTQGGLTWMVNNQTMTWSAANTYCEHYAHGGQTGWRLPTKDELKALYDSGTLSDQGWTLLNTWSSTPDNAVYHYSVDLSNGGVHAYGDTDNDYVTCVR